MRAAFWGLVPALSTIPPVRPTKMWPLESSISLAHSIMGIARSIAVTATWETSLYYKSYFEVNISANQDPEMLDLVLWYTPLVHPEEVVPQSIPRWGRWLCIKGKASRSILAAFALANLPKNSPIFFYFLHGYPALIRSYHPTLWRKPWSQVAALRPLPFHEHLHIHINTIRMPVLLLCCH